MTLRTASLLAFIGTFLLAIVTCVEFVNTILGIVRGLLPALALVPSFVYAFASVTVTIFFVVFARTQPR